MVYLLDEKVRWFGPRFVRKYRVDVAVVFAFLADTELVLGDLQFCPST